MSYSKELIEIYKNAKNYKQYKQVAADFEWKPTTLSEIRNGRSTLPEHAALIIIEECSLDAPSVLAQLQLERAERTSTHEGKAAWRTIVQRLKGIAAILMLTIVFMQPSTEIRPFESNTQCRIMYKMFRILRIWFSKIKAVYQGERGPVAV